MLYAVTDIETTGGFAQEHRIIEVSIYVTNGTKVLKHFTSLVNPERKIPPAISVLTGIQKEMVDTAPKFADIAEQVMECLNDAVFVAHSVNFDYSFIKEELHRCGIHFNSPRLCTVKLGRTIFPGLPSYSLGSLCKSLKISIENRHRADGDAKATTRLFHLYLKTNREAVESEAGFRKKSPVSLPPNVPPDQFAELPETAGVYYFHNSRGQVIYVGKAKNIRSRVQSHFNGKSSSRRVQELNRQVHGIRFKTCGNELVASLLESHEIRRLWPIFNQSQKKADTLWSVFIYTGRDGFLRLGIGKNGKVGEPIFITSSHREAAVFLMDQGSGLCPQRTFLHARFTGLPCPNTCACQQGEKIYNQKVMELVDAWKSTHESYILIGPGRHDQEKAFAAVYQGKVEGYGFLESHQKPVSFYEIWLQIQRTRPNPTALNIVSSYITHPDYDLLHLNGGNESFVPYPSGLDSEIHSLGV